MSSQDKQSKPAPVTGLWHLFAALRYSLAGVKRLWQETAVRHIVLVFVPYFVLLFYMKMGALEICIALILGLALIAVESLNTAIECLVDHLAPDWQEFARDAKDLGSLATMCMLLANGVYALALLLRYLEIF